jgi:hypothetical protein
MASILESLDEISKKIKGHKSIEPEGFEQLAFIVHGNGATYPISSYITGIHLYEDISSTSISGWLDISDPVNFMQAGPIIGEELLYLKFATGGLDVAPEGFAVDFTDNPLHIHSVQRLNYTPNMRLSYRLHFCSPELLRNNRVRLSRAYGGVISDIVRDVMKNVVGTNKILWVEPTLYNKHYVVPNVHPFDFIDDLANSSEALEKHTPTWSPAKEIKTAKPLTSEQVFKGTRNDFLFYEGIDGFYFRPISTPDKDGGLEFTIMPGMSTTGNDNQGGEDSKGSSIVTGYSAIMLRTKAHSFIDIGDKLAGIKEGTWCGTHLRHNGVTKSYKVYKSDYLEALKENRYSHASQTPVYDPTNHMSRKTITQWPEGHIKFSSASSMSDTIISKQTRRVAYPAKTNEPSHSLDRQMQMGHLTGQRLQITLPGISGLRVGMGAYADLPNIGVGAGQPALKGAKELGENRLNNWWIITKVAHIIQSSGPDQGYICNIELMNTMAMTEDKLPEYNSLAAAGGIS